MSGDPEAVCDQLAASSLSADVRQLRRSVERNPA
jgi:hypothetical protein